MRPDPPPVKAFQADFKPATPNPTVRRIWNAVMPAIIRRWFGIVRVDIPDADVARIKALDGKRLLLTSNHPTNQDPALMHTLTLRAGMPFNYLVAREVFDLYGGFFGWLLQRLGAYSVIRGTADRESFRMTRATLSRPSGRLMIFPEGEIYSQNDTLLPFQAGVVQLAIWAMEDARKAGDPDADILIIPAACRYRFVGDVSEPIAAALSRLESTLGLETPSGAELYARLRCVGIAMLETLESEYGLKSKENDDNDLTPRMNALKLRLLERSAGMVGAHLPEGGTLPEKLRTVINAVFAVTREEPSANPSSYRSRLHRRLAARAAPLMDDLHRVANWIAAQDNYVRARPTPERMADNIRRLEMEAFGAIKFSAPMTGLVRVGTPLSLAAAYDAYKTDKRGTVARVTHELEAAVQGLLDEGNV